MPAMKNSGNQWMGLIPYDWRTIKGKYLFTIETGKLDANAEDPDGKYPFFTCSMYPKNINKYAFDCEALLVAGNGLVGFTQYYNGKFNAYQRTYVLSNFQDIHPHFLKHYIALNLPPEAEYKSVGSVIQFIKYDDLANFLIPYPDMHTQIRIANFLDKKCSEIDSLFTDIQSQIDILEEYKKSVITKAVTKGLNPDVEMKDSGIEWVGMIPTHWNVDKGKYFLRYLQKPVRETDDVITCFRDGEVTLRTNRREDGFTISFKEIGYQGIDIGDLVVHGMDGFAGAIGISDSRGKASPVLNVLDADHNKRYLMYYLRNMAYNGVFIALATGIRVRTCDTGWNKLRELPYTLPPKNEQDEIADFIDTKCAEVDAVITDKKAQLETLAEYKKSLIYEYVTGKKEVPENV